MRLKQLVPPPVRKNIRRVLQSPRIAAFFEDGPAFECPCCRHRGRFLTEKQAYGSRIRAKCPACGALERHRLQRCVMDEVLAAAPRRRDAVLHFAPEPFIADLLKDAFGSYVAADISPAADQVRADIRDLQFGTGSFDLVYASHVLEHVDDDARALDEVRRVLRPGGVAVLPVPLVAERTVEYPHPVAEEHYHVRAPGPDYYDRYARHFPKVVVKSSYDYPPEHQLFIHEDRAGFPNGSGPYRPAMQGDRHMDAVPICYA